jgi:protein-export membrane protein SecD
MRANNLVKLGIILLIMVISAYLALPVPKPDFVKNLAFWQLEGSRDLQIKQGLDLKGGLQVLLASDLPGGVQPTTEQMESAKRIIEDRVNGLGVSEPVVQLLPNDSRILVELPGVTDRNLAIDLIKQTGQLEFVDGGFNPPPDGSVISTTYDIYGGLLFSSTVANGRDVDATRPDAAQLLNTAFTGEILQTATPGVDTLGRRVVQFGIKPQFQSVFQQFTSAKLQQSMCIVLDKTVLSCPQIQAVLSDGGQISGNFSAEGASQLALVLSYGSLPVPLKLETTRDIGATLGAESIRRSLIAGAIALAAMAIFMILYYRLPGVLSVVSLLFFTVFSLAIFVLIPITLTLPGIAGFILSIATAVDANILVFERFKEELRGGRTMRASVEAAFSRAWPSIRDSNVSTLIVCAILFIFGSTFGASAVKGFAVTLIIGILVSLFTVMFVSRTLMRLTFSGAEQGEEAIAQRKALVGV